MAREKLEQQRIKKEKQRERNKTRGKLIVSYNGNVINTLNT